MRRADTSSTFTSYTPHDFSQPDALSDFTVALTDNFSLDSLLLNAAHGGWALDSSWRNKNENHAAVTFLISINDDHHAMPGVLASRSSAQSTRLTPSSCTGAVFLSANTRADTLERLLRATKEKLAQRAQAIFAGMLFRQLG